MFGSPQKRAWPGCCRDETAKEQPSWPSPCFLSHGRLSHRVYRTRTRLARDIIFEKREGIAKNAEYYGKLEPESTVKSNPVTDTKSHKQDSTLLQRRNVSGKTFLAIALFFCHMGFCRTQIVYSTGTRLVHDTLFYYRNAIPKNVKYYVKIEPE